MWRNRSSKIWPFRPSAKDRWEAIRFPCRLSEAHAIFAKIITICRLTNERGLQSLHPSVSAFPQNRESFSGIIAPRGNLCWLDLSGAAKWWWFASQRVCSLDPSMRRFLDSMPRVIVNIVVPWQSIQLIFDLEPHIEAIFAGSPAPACDYRSRVVDCLQTWAGTRETSWKSLLLFLWKVRDREPTCSLTTRLPLPPMPPKVIWSSVNTIRYWHPVSLHLCVRVISWVRLSQLPAKNQVRWFSV